jgi:hypothetical protein
MFARSYLTLEIVEDQGWWRAADSINGADAIGRRPSADFDCNGYVIVYFHPITGLERERVLRLDNVPPDGGKYRGPQGRGNMLFIPRGIKVEWLKDKSIRVVIVEGEKKALAMNRIAFENMVDGKPAFIAIGLRGVWGWRTHSTGKREGPNGERQSIPGPLNDFDFLEWEGREVTVLFDSNIHSPKQQQMHGGVLDARRGLTSHLHYVLGATVLFAEMTKEHFEQGLNGPDDLAGQVGPDAVLELLDNARPAIKIREQKPREKLSDAERKARAAKLREAAQSPEARAAEVLGQTYSRYLGRLWAEANLSPESRDLLYTLEIMAAGGDEAEFYYADLYPDLYKSDDSDFEWTATGGKLLKSSKRKRLRDRFLRLEAEQAEAGITFCYLTEGHLDEFDNPVPSRVKLYSRPLIEEGLVLAETLPGFARAKKETRMYAIAQIVREKSGKAYLKKPQKLRSQDKKISDGLKRTKGNLDATVERMKKRGDPEAHQWKAVMEILPAGLIEFIKKQGVDEHLGAENRVTSKSGVSDAESTDDFAGFPKTRRNSAAADPVARGIWERVEARHTKEPDRRGSPPIREMSQDEILDAVDNAVFAEGV